MKRCEHVQEPLEIGIEVNGSYRIHFGECLLLRALFHFSGPIRN
jgi:hypothetical protein